ncbi:MAG TPA: nuclear transport factor 2 family protein [Clostridia bacterium]|nr:nuclear transport factor 2 family protein [Clostridia bacterium]
MQVLLRIALISVVLTLVFDAAAQQTPAAATPSQHTTQADAQEQQAIRNALNSSTAEWNKGSLEGYMEIYWNSPDVTFGGGASFTKGYQQILDHYRRIYQSPGREMGKLDFPEINVNFLSADTALVRGRWHLRLTTREPHGVFTLIMRKFPEGWKIIHDHSSGQ